MSGYTKVCDTGGRETVDVEQLRQRAETVIERMESMGFPRTDSVAVDGRVLLALLDIAEHAAEVLDQGFADGGETVTVERWVAPEYRTSWQVQP